MSNKAYLMTERELAKRLTEEYGEGGMSWNQVCKKFHIRKGSVPQDLETIKSPFATKRRRFTCGSVARYMTKDRVAEVTV